MVMKCLLISIVNSYSTKFLSNAGSAIIFFRRNFSSMKNSLSMANSTVSSNSNKTYLLINLISSKML